MWRIAIKLSTPQPNTLDAAANIPTPMQTDADASRITLTERTAASPAGETAAPSFQEKNIAEKQADLLSPEIVHAVLAGTLRKSISMETLRKELPVRWALTNIAPQSSFQRGF